MPEYENRINEKYWFCWKCLYSTINIFKTVFTEGDDEKDITKFKDYILSHDPTKYMIYDLINDCNGKLDSKLIDTIYNH